MGKETTRRLASIVIKTYDLGRYSRKIPKSEARIFPNLKAEWQGAKGRGQGGPKEDRAEGRQGAACSKT